MPRTRIVLFSLMAVYAIAALSVALTKAPFCDEGWLASPGLNLLRHGTMGTLVLEPAGSWLKAIDRYTYWVMPLWLLAQSLWYALFGFGLTALRSLSTFWGVLGLAACYIIAWHLTRQRFTALLSVLLLAFDTNFIVIGATARMDMMAAMCGFLGIAIYLWLRESHFTRAVFWGHVLVAAGIFSHPNGIIAFLSLCFLIITFDGKRLRWADALLASVPYLAGLAAWGLYIQHDPSAFAAQFVGNAKPGERDLIFHAPLQALKLEVTGRYLDAYSFFAGGLKSLRALPLLLYAVSILASLFTPAIRKNQGFRAALWLTFISCTGLLLIDGFKRTFYLVYVLPPIVLVSANWLTWVWERGNKPIRVLLAASLALIVLIQTGGIVTLVRNRNRQRLFDPATAFLTQHRTPSAIIMGPSELGFRLGYSQPLVDDFRLGFYSGKRPDFIVVDSNYHAFFNSLEQSEQPVYQHVNQLLTRAFLPVFKNDMYEIFERKAKAPETKSSQFGSY